MKKKLTMVLLVCFMVSLVTGAVSAIEDCHIQKEYLGVHYIRVVVPCPNSEGFDVGGEWYKMYRWACTGCGWYSSPFEEYWKTSEALCFH